jgi:Family of unknown function (DUF5681)
MGLAVDSLQISAETARAEGPRKSGGRPFSKGQSGNPAGRKRGSKNKSTLAAQALLEGEAEALTRKAVELAMAGNALALKLCLDRVSSPRRERAVAFALPPIATAEDLAAALTAIADATARGELTPGEAFDLARLADSFLRVFDARDEERRRQQWRAEAAAQAAPRPKQSFREWMDARFTGDEPGEEVSR